MLPTPNRFKVVSGSSEGSTVLNAFDGALLQAGLGNLNLLKVSSILPPGAVQDQDMQIAPGSLVPTAYACITSQTPGDVISSAVGIGFPEDPKTTFGVLMEFSGHCNKEEAERKVTEMVQEGFRMRNMKPGRILVKAVEHKVKSIACAFAAVALWYSEETQRPEELVCCKSVEL